MFFDRDENYNIDDPKDFIFDISGEAPYLRKLFRKLHEIDAMKPEKKYTDIFYQKYIQNLDDCELCKLNSISQKQLERRILEIIQCVNSED